MFYNGEFNIKESWNNNNNNGMNKKADNNNIQNNINKNKISNPLGTPSSIKSNRKSNSQDGPSILNQAGKNLLENQPSTPDLDPRLVDQILKNLKQEGGIADNMFKKPPKVQHHNPVLAPGSILPKKSSSSSSDNDILSLMAARLSAVEKQCITFRQECKLKNDQILELEEELAISKKAGSKVEYQKEMQLQKNENMKLKRQITEMEQFLSDYGLKWKGYEESKKNDQFESDKVKEELQAFTNPKYKYNLPSSIDINIILRRINELNLILEKDGTDEFVKGKDGAHRLREKEELLMGFYSDGIVIQGFKFYKYGSNEGYQILTDLLDGYFPYILKHKYPHGTLIKVLDKTDEKYNKDKVRELIQIDDIEENKLKPMSKDEFLEKLPKQVIKNNQVINVRDEIAKKFNGAQVYNQEQDDKRQLAIKHRVEENGNIVPFTEEQLQFESNQLTEEEKKQFCIIKIRTESGKTNIMLRIHSDKLIEEVYKIAKDFSESKDIQIVNAIYRQMIPIDSKQTLKQLQLHPSAVLNIVKAPK